jgi:hypothetical protein
MNSLQQYDDRIVSIRLKIFSHVSSAPRVNKERLLRTSHTLLSAKQLSRQEATMKRYVVLTDSQLGESR